MTPPPDRESILCAMFESFCVTTIHNFGRNLKRALKNRIKHDGTGEESVEYLIDQLSNEDVYAVEQLILDVDGLPPCSVESELLYNALLSLPDRERRVILYDFWYHDAVNWAAGAGVVSGYGGGLFGPEDFITREQLATMLWRYAGSPAEAAQTLNFTDSGEVSGYALDAIRWAVGKRIINGMGGGLLAPQGLATRAQVAQMLKNYLEG